MKDISVQLPAMTYAATVKALTLDDGAPLTQLCTSVNKVTYRFVKALHSIFFFISFHDQLVFGGLKWGLGNGTTIYNMALKGKKG